MCLRRKGGRPTGRPNSVECPFLNSCLKIVGFDHKKFLDVLRTRTRHYISATVVPTVDTRAA